MAKTARTYRFSDDTLAALGRLKKSRELNETALIVALIREADAIDRLAKPIPAGDISAFRKGLDALIESMRPVGLSKRGAVARKKAKVKV